MSLASPYRLVLIGLSIFLVAATPAMRRDRDPGTNARQQKTPSADHPPGVRWASIPARTFDMGCTAGDRECYSDELPRHAVTLSRPFALMTTEVTIELYRLFAVPPSQPGWNGDSRNPVVNVTWDEAHAFCASVGGRLPTEAEWEYTARGGRAGRRYPWGNEAPVCRPGAVNGARFDDGSRCDAEGPGGHVDPTASFQANALGLFDMAGNVWEWVADWYDRRYYESSPAKDPTGPVSGRFRVVRGASWGDDAWYLRVSNRLAFVPDVRFSFIGFRCARDASH